MMNKSWPWHPLGQLFEIGAGKTMSATAREGARKTPFLRTSNVLWDEIDLSTVDEMAISERELPSKMLKSGDLLVCEGGEIGRAAIWTAAIATMSFQNHLHRLRPLVGDVDPHFYVYFLQSAFTQLGLFDGAGNKTTIPNLSRNRLAALEIPRPPLNEQRGIALALARVREAIRKHDQSTATARSLKRAAMHKLFGHGFEASSQKETEIGLVPENWKVEPLVAHFSVGSGGTPSRANFAYWKHGNIPWVKTTEVNYCVIDEAEEHITQAGLDDSAAKLLPSGTLLLAMYGQGITRGKVAILGIEAACNQACAAIQPKGQEVDPIYLYHFLTARYEAIRQLAHGGQQQNLNLDIVRALPIAFPADKDTQKKIVDILDAIDRKIGIHKRKRDVLQLLFKALLYKLMTGNTKIDQLDLSTLELTEVSAT